MMHGGGHFEWESFRGYLPTSRRRMSGQRLVEARTLTAVQFCQKEMPDKGSDEALQSAMQKVGFPVEMQRKSMSEVSGGWRIKLLLASAMTRQCDILLLDEPTNHLDKASVAWLSDYLVSLEKTSLMIISHDPHFLNAVCTEINLVHKLIPLHQAMKIPEAKAAVDREWRKLEKTSA